MMTIVVDVEEENNRSSTDYSTTKKDKMELQNLKYFRATKTPQVAVLEDEVKESMIQHYHCIKRFW